MTYTSDQVLQGLINYADSEVMNKLPMTGKWVMGTAIGLASTKANRLLDTLKANAIVQMLGVVDEDGMIDVDALTHAMKHSAEKYGKISVDVPMVGTLTFSADDVDNLRAYIN